jgi:acetyl/propionyl-CoA carboxylase alpha subunit
VYETVLVASRGPVARQVVRTCQRLGVRAVTVHSEGDARARHVAEADDSVLIGPAPPEHSYLDPRRVVEAARQAGAQAVHPGSGALALDPVAARAVLDAGLAWVGAAPEVLEAARAVPADGQGRTVTVPVLVPAGAPAVALCDLGQVGDPGSVDPLDPCAVVTSPAPGLDPDGRRAVADAAVALVTELGVRGVAAVDVRTGGPSPRASGLRCALPVEHPVAELLADVDLVEQQLRAAADEPAGWQPVAPTPVAALSLRVYALDLGVDGARISRWREPSAVRVDSGYREGDVVPAWYDPLLATVTVAGASGTDVLSRARSALQELVIEGPRTNLPQLAALLADPSFVTA